MNSPAAFPQNVTLIEVFEWFTFLLTMFRPLLQITVFAPGSFVTFVSSKLKMHSSGTITHFSK